MSAAYPRPIIEALRDRPSTAELAAMLRARADLLAATPDAARRAAAAAGIDVTADDAIAALRARADVLDREAG